MSSTFRPTTPGDAGAIVELMRDVFGMAEDHPGLQQSQMEWKYWRPHEGWEGSRSYVLARDGQVTAHGAVMPLSLVWGERRLRVVNLIDWAARRDRPGAGVTLLQRISRLADGVFTAGGSEEALRVTPAFGFKASPSARRFALPLRPMARLRHDGLRSWKPAGRLVRDVWWRLRARVAAPGGWSAVRLREDQIPDPLPGSREKAPYAYFERTTADVRHLLRCPAASGACYRVERSGEACGYFVLMRAPAQCRIAEAWVNPGTHEDWLALYRLAAATALGECGAVEVTAAAAPGVEAESLLRAGFHDRGEIALRFLMADRSGVGAVRHQLSDGDGAYLHDGRASFWS
jgi:hypothetical protein